MDNNSIDMLLEENVLLQAKGEIETRQKLKNLQDENLRMRQRLKENNAKLVEADVYIKSAEEEKMKFLDELELIRERQLKKVAIQEDKMMNMLNKLDEKTISCQKTCDAKIRKLMGKIKFSDDRASKILPKIREVQDNSEREVQQLQNDCLVKINTIEDAWLKDKMRLDGIIIAKTGKVTDLELHAEQIKSKFGSEMQTLITQLKEKTWKLQAKTEKIAKLQQEFTAIENENVITKKKFHELQAENVQLIGQYHQQRRQFGIMKADYERLQRHQEQDKLEISALKKINEEITDLRVNIAVSKSNLAQCRANTKHLNEETSTCQSNIENIDSVQNRSCENLQAIMEQKSHISTLLSRLTDKERELLNHPNVNEQCIKVGNQCNKTSSECISMIKECINDAANQYSQVASIKQSLIS